MSILFRRTDSVAESRAITSVPFNVDSLSTETSVEKALRVAPVYGAVDLVTGALISVPLHAYRASGDVRVRMPYDPWVVADPAPGVVDPLTWRSQYVASMMLRGNAYGLLGVQSLTWLNPDAMQVRQDGHVPSYWYAGQELAVERVVHVRGLTMPGSAVGLSPLTLFRYQIESGLGADEYTRNWFRQGAAPSAVFRNSAKTMTQAEADTAKKRFKATVRNGDVLVVGADWDYTALTVGAKDAQFVEAANLTANQIAAVYHVPPEELGGTSGGSLTYATLESYDRKFVTRAVMPWAARLEAALSTLLPRPQYVKFNLDAYVRTDLKTRMDAHAVALNVGLETIDEARALEDRPPLTPEQVAAWQENYRKQQPPASGGMV